MHIVAFHVSDEVARARGVPGPHRGITVKIPHPGAPQVMVMPHLGQAEGPVMPGVEDGFRRFRFL